jgi:N-formylglutamate amidohydrolase
MEKFDGIVLNIPHAAVLNGVFSKDLGGWGYNSHLINEMILDHCDLFSDFIFHYDHPKVTSVIAEYSRFVVDMERLKDDPLESIGQGMLYTHYCSYNRAPLSPEAKSYLVGLWEAYQQRLYDELQKKGRALLIDCHSFSSRLAKDVDVCIGFNEDSSKPDEDTLRHIVSVFEKHEYKVSLNFPYSNSITPLYSGEDGTVCPYKSVMIEVRKGLYMDQYRHTIKDDTHFAPRLSHTLHELYESLLKF